MTLEGLREFCRKLPGTTEDIKWEDNAVFSVERKMYCLINVDAPWSLSVKSTPEDAAELVEREGIRPAPYMARNHWVTLDSVTGVVSDRELRTLIVRSYDLVRAGLPKRVRESLKPVPDALRAR